jgi:hypothetical protein
VSAMARPIAVSCRRGWLGATGALSCIDASYG